MDINEEDNFDNLNNNIDSLDTFKTNQINISKNYNKNLYDYLNNENNIYNKNLQNNDFIINSNNNSSNYNNEINTIRQEIILLKSKVSETELVINQYKYIKK